MKRLKTKYSVIYFIIVVFTLAIAISCDKEDDDVNNGNNEIECIDIEGNSYKTEVIGEQIWMAENLKVTKYNNGTPIPNITDNIEWTNLTNGAYAWYENDESSYKDAYGALYNWYAVYTGNLCPAGWHVPTDAEWTTLIKYIDIDAGPDKYPEPFSNIAGGKLKSTRTNPDAHPRWESPNTGATDEYGFSALPGGARDGLRPEEGEDEEAFGNFKNLGGWGVWWSANGNLATFWIMVSGSEGILYSDHLKENGFSVRCIKATD